MTAGVRSARVEAPGVRAVSVSERVRRIDGLDLEPLVYKLLHPDAGGAALSLDLADEAVRLYRGFLKLCVLYPDRALVPSQLVDQAWHAHILDTAKYRADCYKALGYFLDHFPYAGLRGDADRQRWTGDFARTRNLFWQHFGVEVGVRAASACHDHGDGSDCCTGCISSDGPDARPRPQRDDALPVSRGAQITPDRDHVMR